MSPTHILTDPDPDPDVDPGPVPTSASTAGDGTDAEPSAVATTVAAAKSATRQEKAWLRLSATLSAQVPALAEREDVTVTVAPGAGRGAPGCFVPALATIELDGNTLTTTGIDPVTCHPERHSDRERYAPTWGVFTHECAHARYSLWPSTVTDSTTPAPGGATIAAAMLLEETRIEAAHLTRRPGDRHWLRAAATALIMPEFAALEAAALEAAVNDAEHTPGDADDADDDTALPPAPPTPTPPTPGASMATATPAPPAPGVKGLVHLGRDARR